MDENNAPMGDDQATPATDENQGSEENSSNEAAA